MATEDYQLRRERLFAAHDSLTQRANQALPDLTGWFHRYKYPVLTAAHTPIFWRYDLDQSTNPFLMERLGINAVFNVGAKVSTKTAASSTKPIPRA
jgi:4-O-beta-D-mannosyl-D-glucose phosphorylase